MKKYFFLILITFCCFCSELYAPDLIKATVKQYLNDLKNLSTEQRSIMMSAYTKGKAEGYDLLLPAIAWKESYFGKYPINVADGKYGSYGPYHVRLDIYALRKKEQSTFHMSMLAVKFINDIDFSSKVTLEYINYFARNKPLSDTPIYDIAARYNGGNNGHTKKQAKLYALDVLLRMKALDIYINKTKKNLHLDNEIALSYRKTHS